MRVLMISKALVVGAYQRKAELIAAHSDVELTVVVPTEWNKHPAEQVYTRGYDLLMTPLRFSRNYHLHYYPHLRSILREVQPDIVHIDEEPYNLATWHAWRAARSVDAKTLFFSWQNIERRYPPPFSLVERQVLNGVDYGLVGNSEAVDVWRVKGYSGPLEVLPQFGVDEVLFPYRVPNPDQTPLRIGYAGRLVEEKGLDVLIKAINLLPGAWHLRIVGDGPDRDRLQTVAGLLNIGGGVAFDPPRKSTEMPAFYHDLDVLVLPSLTRPNWKEQFGRVLIEAMSSGVVVVGARSGAIPEVIDDAGLLFDEGDENALRDCLHALMTRPALRLQLAEAGRARVEAHYTQRHIAARTVEVYRGMVR